MIMPNGYGKSRSFFFCFKCFRLKAARSTGDTKYRKSIDAEGSSDDPDVVAEAKRVKEGTTDGREIAVELIGLSKVFHGDLRAVDSISYGVDDNFVCAVSHNGAGKTTTINMLAGNMALLAEALARNASVTEMGSITHKWGFVLSMMSYGMN